MKQLLRIRPLLLCAAIALAMAMPAFVAEPHADEDDHDQARSALEQHKILPLTQILEQLRPKLKGRIVGTELEQDHGVYLYEFKIVTPNGRLEEVYVDALTGKILKEGGED